MERLVADLRNAIDDLRTVDADTLTDDELSELVVALHTESARLDAARVAVTGVWDSRGVGPRRGQVRGRLDRPPHPLPPGRRPRRGAPGPAAAVHARHRGGLGCR